MPTGPGELDSEGIWLFGEADDETLMSDTLNLGQSATSAAFTLDRGRISDLEDAAILHAEFTATSASVASATLSSIGTIANDAARSNDTGFVTASTNKLTIASAGIYAIDINGTLPLAPSGVCYLRLDTAVGFAETYLVNPTSTSRIWGGSFFGGIYLPAASELTFQFYHTSSGSRVLTTRIGVTKVGRYA